jgi:sugar (pentulose or hexulose) kinase
VGAWASVDEACNTAVNVRERIEPETAASTLMDRNYQTYKLIYPALRHISGGGNGF